NQLARTVEALVAAERYEAGGSQGTADAASVAATAADACTGLADERQVALEVTQPAQPMRIGGDPDLAERSLQPGGENACRYATTRVRITIGRSDAAVCYEIKDDGPGVRDDEQERIFEPGVRGTAATSDGGAGLGLALARRLARSVDGEVRAEAT